GMGLLAQMSENITLNGFSVCLRGADDPRYFTTQADATHFSGCKGLIRSENGLYENMMDDAINVHGTYLKVTKRLSDNVLIGTYMHSQAYGFRW
ncbi:MAG: alpha-1,3-galactosidase B, partial [Mucinivorans sp.]